MHGLFYALQVGVSQLGLLGHLYRGLVPLAVYVFAWWLTNTTRSKRGPLVFNRLGAVALAFAGLLPSLLFAAMLSSQSYSMKTIEDLSGVFALNASYEKACRYDRKQMSAGELEQANQDLHRSDILWLKQGTAINRPLQKEQAVDCSMTPRLASVSENANLKMAFMELYYLCIGVSVILGWGLMISVLILVLRGSRKVKSPVPLAVRSDAMANGAG